ncbi:MAG: TIGR04255 family protein [Chloroflexi bacterium]|nr:TIGR04255 family protein [Chloroflexota bacterium]
MALHFPEVEEVRLGNSPLREVVCQVKFPPILRIANSEPVEFQELIRDRFTEMDSATEFVLDLSMLGREMPQAQQKIYRFMTPDRQITVSLTKSFYALSTTNYTHWKDFVGDLELINDSMSKIYRPKYASRIGLRYINRLTLDNTGVATTSDLFGLLRPELTAQVLSDSWSAPQEWLSRIVLSDESAKLTLSTAYGLENAEPVFVLDFDYFEEGQLDIRALTEYCQRYHDQIYKAFRWSFRD